MIRNISIHGQRTKPLLQKPRRIFSCLKYACPGQQMQCFFRFAFQNGEFPSASNDRFPPFRHDLQASANHQFSRQYLCLSHDGICPVIKIKRAGKSQVSVIIVLYELKAGD
jgi:hypothetical protein